MRAACMLGLLVACGGSKEPDPPKLLDTGWFVDTASLDPETCVHVFADWAPKEGATDWYWRDAPVAYTDTDRQQVYGASLASVEGGAVQTEQVWDESGLSFTVAFDGQLVPATDYTLTLTDCRGTLEVPFRTSDYGLPLDDGPEALTGTTWNLDLVNATWLEPPQLGTLMSLYFTNPVLLGVQSATADHLDLLGAPGEVDSFGEIVQDAKAATWDFPPTAFDQAPFFSAEVDHIVLGYLGSEVPIHDFHLEATVSADGRSLGGGVLSGLGDTRNLGDLVNDPGNLDAICEVASGLGVQCEACPDDGAPYCLKLSVVDVEGTLVEDLRLQVH